MKRILASLWFLSLAFNASAFDTESYCRKMEETEGGSYEMMKSCIKREGKLRASLEESKTTRDNTKKIYNATQKKYLDKLNYYLDEFTLRIVTVNVCDYPTAVKLKDDFIEALINSGLFKKNKTLNDLERQELRDQLRADIDRRSYVNYKIKTIRSKPDEIQRDLDAQCSESKGYAEDFIKHIND